MTRCWVHRRVKGIREFMQSDLTSIDIMQSDLKVNKQCSKAANEVNKRLGMINRNLKSKAKKVQSNLGITATVKSGHLAHYGHLPRSRTFVHHKFFLLLRPLCNAYSGHVFATHAYKCVQLTSAYSSQTFSFEVIGHHIFNGRYCVHGVRPGAGVNSVVVSHARSSMAAIVFIARHIQDLWCSQSPMVINVPRFMLYNESKFQISYVVL